jgi:hypothetical protein
VANPDIRPRPMSTSSSTTMMTVQNTAGGFRNCVGHHA